MTSKESTRDLEDSLWQSAVRRLTRGIGWIVFIAGFGAIVVYGFTEFLLDPGVEILFKVFLLTGSLGLLSLFVSVLWDRVIDSRTDKYKEVEK